MLVVMREETDPRDILENTLTGLGEAEEGKDKKKVMSKLGF